MQAQCTEQRCMNITCNAWPSDIITWMTPEAGDKRGMHIFITSTSAYGTSASTWAPSATKNRRSLQGVSANNFDGSWSFCKNTVIAYLGHSIVQLKSYIKKASSQFSVAHQYSNFLSQVLQLNVTRIKYVTSQQGLVKFSNMMYPVSKQYDFFKKR